MQIFDRNNFRPIQHLYPCQYEMIVLRDMPGMPMGMFFANATIANWWSRQNFDAKHVTKIFEYLWTVYVPQVWCITPQQRTLGWSQVGENCGFFR